MYSDRIRIPLHNEDARNIGTLAYDDLWELHKRLTLVPDTEFTTAPELTAIVQHLVKRIIAHDEYLGEVEDDLNARIRNEQRNAEVAQNMYTDANHSRAAMALRLRLWMDGHKRGLNPTETDTFVQLCVDDPNLDEDHAANIARSIH